MDTNDSTERVRQKTISKEKPFEWNKNELPLTPQECLSRYYNFLSEFERTEIVKFKRV